MKLVTITPKMAEELLAKNISNRSISRMAVNAIARDMQAGHFRLNGESIKTDDRGNLIDGQHRLSACIVADTPFTTWMMEGLSQDDKLTIDRGRPRAIGDNLAISHGIMNGRQVAAAVRNLVIFAEQDLSAKPTSSEVYSLIETHPHIIDSANYTFGVSPARPSLLAAIHYVGSYIQGLADEANEFVEVFKSGVPFYEGDAAHAVREVLIKDISRGIRGTNARHYSIMANAWEKFSTLTPMKAVRIREDFVLAGWDEEELYKTPPNLEEQRKAS